MLKNLGLSKEAIKRILLESGLSSRSEVTPEDIVNAISVAIEKNNIELSKNIPDYKKVF
ncbi:hypothetical protein ACIQYG_20920 [Peribacillus sp. NPDC096622]|uniref:hypothetical protein n=1 Tax=Peribacillus sp. NPDC096622 TaxID=3364396 RepID=UPI00382140ED